MNKMPLSPPPPPQFVTHCPRRYQAKFKFHKTLGHAKSAIVQQGYGTIWQWDEAENVWVVLYDIAVRTPVQSLPWNVEKTAREAEEYRQRQIREVQARMRELDGL
jgi:hypothetical protein